ncbi:MAG: M16 family metallopeptidase [bacterium JZ-2024 1]
MTANLVKRATESFLSYEKRVRTFVLDNGLKLLVLPRNRAPIFAFRTYVNVGSADEVPGKTGLAHLFEHMAFKGSREIGTRDFASEKVLLQRIEDSFRNLQAARARGTPDSDLSALLEEFNRLQEEARRLVEPNEFALIVEQEGGVGINAFTSNDSTQYFYALPSNRLELWAYLESERFAEPVLREFYTEREVVIEERRMSTDNSPIGRFYEKWIETAFGKSHPYGRPVIGYAEDLASLAMSDAQDFFQKYYAGQNITIAVVGDVDPDLVFETAAPYLSRIPAGMQIPPRPAPQTPGPGERILELTDPAQPMLLIGYMIPGFNHPDRHCFSVLLDALAGTRSSRLYRRLVKEEKKAIALEGTILPGARYDRLLTFYVLPAPGVRARDLIPLIDEEMQRVYSEGIQESELDRFRARALTNLIRQNNSNSGLAGMLTFYEVIAGDWHALFHEIEQVRILSLDHVNSAARRVLRKENRTIGLVENHNGGAA